MRATRSLRTRLLVHFLAFALASAGGIVLLSWHTHRSHRQAAERSEQLKTLSQQLHGISLLTHRFLLLDACNVDYHRTRSSPHLMRKRSLERSIAMQFERVRASLTDGADVELLVRVREAHVRSSTLLDTIVVLTLMRGMEDHGLEGLMRRNAHALETSGAIPLPEVLAMRRSEKDYIIRHQDRYVERLHTQVDEQVARLAASRSEGTRTAIGRLVAYRCAFDSIVRLDHAIGVHDRSGAFAELGKAEELAAGTLNVLMLRTFTSYRSTERRLMLIYFSCVAAAVLISIGFALVTSERITVPIRDLAGSVQRFVQSGFTDDVIGSGQAHRDREIFDLERHFMLLHHEIKGHILNLNGMVHQRTLELQAEKERIRMKNNELMASLTYARGLQESMLTSGALLEAAMPEHFLINQPRDIVGGDFVWAHASEQGDRTIIHFALADCTGHGVPGSLLSIMCHHTLNTILSEPDHGTPAAILAAAHARLESSSVGRNPHGDGMNIGLCAWDPSTGVLTFAGSVHSLVVLDHGVITKFKGDRASIGGELHKGEAPSFTDHRIELSDGAMAYLYSDGIIDQFGGPAGRKFSSNRLTQLFEGLHSRPLGDQRNAIEHAFNDWKGALEQIDDASVLGVRLRRDEAGSLGQVA